VRTGARFTLQPDAALQDIDRTDLVFIPSCGLELDAVLAREQEAIDFIRVQHERGARVAGVCSGVGLLAAAGILDGRMATTHWALAGAYADRFPRVDWRPQEMITEDAGIYCGGGVNAALDLSLHLVERLVDRDTATHCSRALLIEMPRECQAGFAVLPTGTPHTDMAIRRAEDWIRNHCAEDFSTAVLAKLLGMSSRNFVRRFKAATGLTPVDYMQRLRLRAAKRLLEEAHASVQEISSSVGYTDVPFFRALFKRHTGMSPAEYRRRFGAKSGATGQNRRL